MADSSGRWLNVVLDLNGILCACERAWEAKGFRNYDFSKHSGTIPTKVGPKLVRVRPGCSEFLTKLSKFAYITIWSSMMACTTSQICKYLFQHSPLHPFKILGQEDCDRIPVHKGDGRTSFMKELGTRKDIFLKTLSNHVFSGFGGHYTSVNTLVIDDSPIKHMLNMSENVLLLPGWSHEHVGAELDAFLVEELLPYLFDLHQFEGSLAEYRSSHPSGREMFYNDRETCGQYVDILNAIEASKKLRC